MRPSINRSAVSNRLDTAKNHHISSLLSDPSSSKRWRQLRSLGTLKKSLPSALSHFSMTSLNTHFSSVTNRHPPLNLTDLPDILNTPIPPSNIPPFSFTPVTDAQVLSVINSTYTNSTGPDHIFKSMLKIASPTILPHLTALINSSFFGCTFPFSWKNSHIGPLLKTITSISPSHTRPIALLPEMAKIQERLAFELYCKYPEIPRVFLILIVTDERKTSLITLLFISKACEEIIIFVYIQCYRCMVGTQFSSQEFFYT